VYNSKFMYSRISDNYLASTGGFSFVGNYSTGSAPFLTSEFTRNPAYIMMQSNTIASTAPVPVSIRNQGPIILLDNRIAAGATSTTGVLAATQPDTDVFSMGNVFTSPTGVTVSGRLTSLDDKVHQIVASVEPQLPETPPRVNQKVIEVDSGASSAEIQSAVDMAARFNGRRPIVHLAYGRYDNINVTVPPSDLQIVGDGFYLTTVYGGIKLRGPATRVSLREISFRGAGKTGDGVSITGVDQPGARIVLDQAQTNESGINLLVDHARNVTVDARNIGHTLAGDASFAIEGAGNINIFSGASYGNELSYRATGGSLVVRDMWYDGGGSKLLKASGGSTVSVAGTQAAMTYSAVWPAFDFNSFFGRAALLSSLQLGRIEMSGLSAGTLLAAGIVGYTDSFLINSSPGQAAMLNSKRVTWEPTATAGSTTVPDQGYCDPACLRAATAQLRLALPRTIVDLPAYVTDVRLERVGIAAFSVGLHIQP
jgi:hypothetical protein